MKIKKIIGTKYLTYAEKRNFVFLFRSYEIKRVVDFYVLLAAAYLRLTGRADERWANWVNLHNDFGLSKCVGFHFWNATSFSKKPWVTTLELVCREPMRLEHLSHPQCRKVFCLSSWTMNCQKQILKTSPYRDAILPKLELLHPPQKVNVSAADLANKNFNNRKLKFIFVGRDFFRKGGYECVKAFSEIIRRGFDVELVIVSKLDRKDYPSSAPEKDLKRAHQLIKSGQDRIKFFKELRHQDVLRLIAESDIGLLPTYLDSYGYSVLEFFSYGCPVITTNIQALSEINHSDRGWILDMPLVETEYGSKKIDRDSSEKRERMSAVLTELLINTIISILENRGQLSFKSIAALKYIEQSHNQDRNVDVLEKVYATF